MSNLVIATAQIAMRVGDIDYNKNLVVTSANMAENLEVDICVFPELTLCGYPPEDLLLKPHFIEANVEALDWLCDNTKHLETALVVGYVDRIQDETYNACAFIHKGIIHHIHHKMKLPTYDVFDEKRYFSPGKKIVPFVFNDIKISMAICEDVWYLDPWTSVNTDVVLSLNASPYHMRKAFDRQDALQKLGVWLEASIVYCNAVGAQDELVFDGGSMVFDEARLIGRAPQFVENLSVFDLHEETGPAVELLDENEELLTALISGTKNYVLNNGFKDVVIGLSGGIDSALVAYIASKALGPNRVHTIAMPSRYSSDGSLIDAEELVKSLKISDHKIISIDQLVHQYDRVLIDYFVGCDSDATEENIQARIRGNILMAFSNKFKWMVLSTGNKSETVVGHCTLYGDMTGGFNPIKDVYKTRVYDLCRFINELEGFEAISVSIIEKEPSAELRHDQKDSETLPPYEVLDAVLKLYIEQDASVTQIQQELNIPIDIITYVVNLVDRAEYKRRQAAPGVRVTPKAFGKDRRLPITNAFQETIEEK